MEESKNISKKIRNLILSSLFFIILFLFMPLSVKAGVTDNAIDAYYRPATYYETTGESPFVVTRVYDTDFNIYISGVGSSASYSSLRYATVGYRVWFGPSAEYYIDLALQYYNVFAGDTSVSVQVASQVGNGLCTLKDERISNGTVYSLYEINYKNMQKAVVAKYGVGSAAANYLTPLATGTKDITLWPQPIMTAADVNVYSKTASLRCGYAIVSGDHSSVSYQGPVYTDKAGMVGYWASLTGNYNPDIANLYDHPVSLKIKQAPALANYVQTTTHNFKSAQTGQYNTYKTTTDSVMLNTYYTPRYLKAH